MGFRHVTHLYSATSTVTRKSGFRIAGVLEAAYYIDGMNIELIADGCHLPTSLIKFATKFKSHDRISLITDAMSIAGTDATEGYIGAKDSPTPVIVEDGVAKLTDRTAFGGSIATADRLIRTALDADIPLYTAVKMLTENPLRSMGLIVKKGRIEAGYDADLVLFDSDISVKSVIVGGKTVI
jgi:N-acetylglucosamine-6-phosphate deacetylase